MRQPDLRSAFGTWLPLALAFAAPCMVLLIVRAFVIDVPFLDEWQWTPMIVAWRHGEIAWNEIWPLHNEHRIVVPSLIALLLATPDRAWVITRETTFSVALLFATLAAWWAVIVRIVPAGSRPWTIAVVALLASSLAQAENWVWGFQIAWFIANLCFAIMVWAFVRADERWSVFVAALALVIAVHSTAFGFAAVPAGMVFYALRGEWRQFIGWSLLSLALILSYARDWHPVLYHAVAAPFLVRVWTTELFALTVLGAPIARSTGTVLCACAGFLGVAMAALLVAQVARRPPPERRAFLPLLALAILAVTAALEIAYGRLSSGWEWALGGRFVTPASLLWVGLIIAFTAVVRDIRPAFIAAVAPPIALLWLVNQAAGYAEVRDRSLLLYAQAQAIPRWNVATEDELRVLWPAEVFLGPLNAIHDGPFYMAETATSN